MEKRRAREKDRKKKLFTDLQLVGKYAFFVDKFILATLMLMNQSKEEELVKNTVFSLIAGRPHWERVNQTKEDWKPFFH